jgi:hypothetical protein
MPRDTTHAQDKAGPHLAHMVYFTLKDKSPAAQKRLIDSAYKHLKGHEGEVYFSCGALVDDLKRPVNDRDFQVGLHIVFNSRKAHDMYQTHPRHEEFIREGKENWEKVRVFDTYVR